jgi:hypothetical protein
LNSDLMFMIMTELCGPQSRNIWNSFMRLAFGIRHALRQTPDLKLFKTI